MATASWIRALEKKLRHIAELRERELQGGKLDGAQLLKLSRESLESVVGNLAKLQVRDQPPFAYPILSYPTSTYQATYRRTLKVTV